MLIVEDDRSPLVAGLAVLGCCFQRRWAARSSLSERPVVLGREAIETQAPVPQWRKSACIGVGSCCLPVLAFEPAHTGAGTGRLVSAGRR